MESAILIYSVRHQAFGRELAKRVKALGWDVSTEEGDAVIVIADAHSWAAEGLRNAYEDWGWRMDANRLLVVWVSAWGPVPLMLPPGAWVRGWSGGQFSSAEHEAIRQFLERCSSVSARKAKAAPELVWSPPAAPVSAQPAPEESIQTPKSAPPVAIPIPPLVVPMPSIPRPAPAPAAPAPAQAVTPPPALKKSPLPSPAIAPPRRDARTSVFCPETLEKGRWFTLQVWLHGPDQSGEVTRMAAESGHGGLAGRKSGLAIASGALVGFSLVPKVLQTKRSLFGSREPQHRYAQWNEAATNVDFAVCCPKSFREPVLHESIEISVEGIPVGSCTVELAFDRSGEMKTEFARIRTAFASYASQDRELVLGRLQMLAATVGLEPFFDVESLRMGEDWEQRLMREVPSKDRFLLFWSENARKSEWVEREWRLALRAKGLEYILPVPLQPASPPKELSKLQFNDRYARMADYERLRRQGKPG